MKSKKYIIIADDDEDDQLLMRSAFEEINYKGELVFVSDGLELKSHVISASEKGTFPHLVMMDLNMPKKNGREILAEFAENDKLKNLPVIILSTSQAPFDINSSYLAGASSYLIKPSTYIDLVKMVQSIVDFWMNQNRPFDPNN